MQTLATRGGRGTLNVLYLTYDGLLDPLGGSQILPYLMGSRPALDRLHILSFEKSARYAAQGEAMRARLAALGIAWTPLTFTSGLGPLGKVWDLARMYCWGLRLARATRARVVHTRGHATAPVGALIKRLFGAGFVFDFRGLWVDERVDKGGWNLDRPLDRLQYRFFKRDERKLLARADQVVVLTHAVVGEVVKLGAAPADKITVIPCCADFDHFVLATPARRAAARQAQGLPVDASVLGYLGSVGKMYRLERFFRLFELVAERDACAHALVITQDTGKLAEVMARVLPVSLHSRVKVTPANRDEVPAVLPAMSVLVGFVQPSYARISMSPTKMGECFAAGIPVICNAGVGDVVEQVRQLNAGLIVDPDADSGLVAAADRLAEISAQGGERLREAARKIFGLELAVARYQSIYRKLS